MTESTGTRTTRQRLAVAQALDSQQEFRSAQEIHAMIYEGGVEIGLSTVYRQLQSLADAGEVDVLRLGSGETVYRRCSTGHHHHLVCRSCGRTVEVEGPTVERWAKRIAEEYDFTDVSHEIEVFGTCASCAGQDG